MSDDRPLTAPEPAASDPSTPSAESGPLGSAAPREPDAPQPDLVFCANCKAHVDPAGKGLCPACGRFLPENVVALVTGLRSKKLAKIVDQYRVDLIEQLFKERGGKDALDVVSRIAIENYALVCAQHKTIEARLDQDGLFTQTGRRRSAFDMLKAISETIDRLRAELPPPSTRTSQYPGFAQMPVSALELTRDLLKRLKAGETLSEFEQGQLAVLRGAMRAEVTLSPDPVDDVDAPSTPINTHRECDGLILPEPGDSGYVEEITPTIPVEPTCGYGCGTLTRCAEIQKTRLDAWAALHYTDPKEIERRRKEATAVMMARVGKPHPWGHF